MATKQTTRSRNTKTMLKRRRERKKVLAELRKIVPFVNEHTPLLELLQKVIDYITELQELLNNSTVYAIESKENLSPWRINEPEYKLNVNPYNYCSSPFTRSI